LLEVLLTGKFTYAIPIRERLRLLPAARFQAVQAELTKLLGDDRADARRRFGAALALSAYVPASDPSFWKSDDLAFVTRELVSANPEYQPELRRALRPLEGRLRPDLERLFSDATATDAQRLAAANAFADYAPRETAKLADLLTVATPEQYAVLYPLVESGRTDGIVKELGRIAARLPPDDLGSVERVPFGQRRANAAATLLRLGEREVALPVFLMKDDPEALTQFIFRCRPRGVGVETLLDCLEIVSAAPPGRYAKETRYALLLALAEFRLSEVPDGRRSAVLKQVREWYANDPSSGVHGASNWLLRQWGESAYVKQIDETSVAPSMDREWFTLAVKVKPEAASSLLGGLSSPKSAKPITFHYTFVVFPAGEYTIGSPDDEPNRAPDEVRHRARLTRPFAILNREVTFAELIAFNRERYEYLMGQMSQRPESSVAGVDWYDAVQFSRWLGTQYGLSESDQAYADPDSPSSGPRETSPSANPSANWAPRNWPLDPRRRGFRRPSEAEREIASRGDVRTSYGFGSDVGLLDRYGWFQANSGGRMHSPLELRPGHRGLFDMHGNAFEWVHDWYGDYGGSRAADPLGATKGLDRVVRGGSWSDVALCRTARRIRLDPTLRSYNLGFRLALSFVGVPAESGQDKKK
jgi:formylglycine-generating enzyme required for sulfatase activity